MRIKKYGDLCIGLFFLVFSLIYASQIPSIRITNISVINSEAYPTVVAALSLLFSVWQTILGIKKAGSFEAAEGGEEETKEYKTVLRTLLLALAYVVVLEPLGFLPSSALYLFLQMLVLCPQKKIRPVRFILISLIASMIIYCIFRFGLDLMLPPGILLDIFG
ncbi:hypothetical protein FACS1894206_05320 [Deltaproteobacteria bacterium]|nr:hypothetical protein FACS1894206_05320 [Deltaproteobacteria bacterium]